MQLADRLADFPHTPVNQFFGMSLRSCGSGQSEIELAPRAEQLQEEGVIHGSVITAVADTAGVYCILDALPRNRSLTSIEFKLNFVRPATPERGKLLARGQIVRQGRTIALCDVEVFQADELIAKGLFTYILFDKPA